MLLFLKIQQLKYFLIIGFHPKTAFQKQLFLKKL